MKANKVVLLGLIFLLFAGILSITDILTPFIRPLTYTFLMGSSKGKDILFFALMGILLLLSQLSKIKKLRVLKNIDERKFLKLTIILSTITLSLGIFLEIYFRIKLGVEINSIFVSIRPTFSTTSIIHTHLMKSILGEFLITYAGPILGHGINTASALYQYVEPFSIIIIILMVSLFVTSIISIQNRNITMTILISFFTSILMIGCLDGGIFGIPGLLGWVGCVACYRNEYYIVRCLGKLFKNKKMQEYDKNIPQYKLKKHSEQRFVIERILPYIIVIFIIILRITVAMIGTNPDYYEIDIYNPDNNITLSEYPVEKITHLSNETIYQINPNNLNEQQLANNLSHTLNHSCDYYTVSWNLYSYF